MFLLFSQPATEPEKSGLTFPSYFFKFRFIHVNVPLRLSSSKLLFSFIFSQQIPLSTYLLSVSFTCLTHLILFQFIILTFAEGYKSWNLTLFVPSLTKIFPSLFCSSLSVTSNFTSTATNKINIQYLSYKYFLNPSQVNFQSPIRYSYYIHFK